MENGLFILLDLQNGVTADPLLRKTVQKQTDILTVLKRLNH